MAKCLRGETARTNNFVFVCKQELLQLLWYKKIVYIHIYIYTTFIYVIFCCPHQNLATTKNGWVDSTAAARNMFWYKFLPEHFPSTCFSLHPAYITPNQRFPIEKNISKSKSIKIIFWNPLLYFSLGLNSQSWISRAVTRVGAGHLENPEAAKQEGTGGTWGRFWVVQLYSIP